MNSFGFEFHSCNDQNPIKETEQNRVPDSNKQRRFAMEMPKNFQKKNPYVSDGKRHFY